MALVTSMELAPRKSIYHHAQIFVLAISYACGAIDQMSQNLPIYRNQHNPLDTLGEFEPYI